MSEKIETGGPAFPTNYKHRANDPGMDLRDYFAAKAMQGFLAAEYAYRPDGWAKEAYEMADAMLKAREVK